MHEWLAKQSDAPHDRGERTNAPLLCYLLGIARGSAELDELAEIVRSTS